eukprot:sb/3462720/
MTLSVLSRDIVNSQSEARMCPQLSLLQVSVYTHQDPTDTSKMPIRTRYLCHVTGYQPIRDQYFLIRSVPDPFYQDVMMFKTPLTTTLDDVPDNIEVFGEEPYKYVLFGVFIFVLLLAVLLLLTILIGLVTTILGCCRVNDDLAPNERKSGTCGSLMMCTSYCSVMLCAIATLVAAILVTVVMVNENLCKQYSDDKLISVLSDGYTIEGVSVNLTQTMNDTLDIEGGLQVTFEEVMKSCENSATLISAFKFTKDTSVAGQSIASIQQTIQDVICRETGLSNLTDAQDKIDTLISNVGNGKATTYNLTGCATGLDYISTAANNIDTTKPTVLSQITYMEGNATEAEGYITNVIDGVTSFTSILTDQFIKDILITVTFEEVMKSCENSATLISAFKFTKDTSVAGQSIASIQQTIQDEVDKFNASSIVDGLSLDFSHVNTSELETNKDALTSTFDFDSVKNTIANTSLTGLSNLTDAQDKIDTLISNVGNTKATAYNLTGCATGLDYISTAANNIDTTKPTVLSQITYMEGNATEAEGYITNVIDGVTSFTSILTDQFIKDILITQIDLALAGATSDINDFVDYLFLQLQTTLVNCQPLSALYKTVFNYSCDSILIHITLIYCSLSLIGISLFFYMCISRCLARYFINYPNLHPNDVNREWKPYPGAQFENYAQTKL